MLPEGFTPAPRVTEADKTGDVQTINRKLQERVYLAIPDNDDKWDFPTVMVKEEDETLLDAAKRAVQGVSKTMDIWCPSNCPWAVDLVVPKENTDKPTDGSYFGTKTFFIKVQHDEGEVGGSKEHAWLTRSEMVERIKAQEGVNAS